MLLGDLRFAALEVMISSFIFLSLPTDKIPNISLPTSFSCETCPGCPLSALLLSWDSEKDVGGHRRHLLPRLHRGVHHRVPQPTHGAAQEWPAYQDRVGGHVVEVPSGGGGWQPGQDPLPGTVPP